MGSVIHEIEPESRFWLHVVAVVVLVLISGLMSGLNLGLLSMRLVDLEVIKRSGKPEDRKLVEKVAPVVRQHHLVLVTLLLTNAMALEALPLFVESLVDPWLAIVASVILILIFGEILPMAVCSRYGLAIGAKLAPVVRLLLFIMFPIAWPVSKLLDRMLGPKRAGLFGRPGLKTLVEMHGIEAGKGGELSRRETRTIGRVLGLAGKTARYCMTPIEDTFCIDTQSKLDDPMLKRILASSYRRIPVYTKTPDNIVGMILVKDVLNCFAQGQANDQTIRDLSIRKIPCIPEGMQLHNVLGELNKSQTQMAITVSLRTLDVAEKSDPARADHATAVRRTQAQDLKNSTGTTQDQDLENSTGTNGGLEDGKWDITGIITLGSVVQALMDEEGPCTSLDSADSKPTPCQPSTPPVSPATLLPIYSPSKPST